jgi:hypothetical protein
MLQLMKEGSEDVNEWMGELMKSCMEEWKESKAETHCWKYNMECSFTKIHQELQETFEWIVAWKLSYERAYLFE